MARIPDGVIERLKATVSVQRLADARGVVLTKHGADPARPLSVPRGSHTLTRDHPGEEPLALSDRRRVIVWV
jgi:hypothetical protein